jgi:hypothetical protein
VKVRKIEKSNEGNIIIAECKKIGPRQNLRIDFAAEIPENKLIKGGGCIKSGSCMGCTFSRSLQK